MKRAVAENAAYRALRRVPMPVLAILIGLLAGLPVWGVLDRMQGYAVTKIFNSELRTQLRQRSRESLVRFDRYVGRFIATTRLLANHRRLADYLDILAAHAEVLGPVTEGDRLSSGGQRRQRGAGRAVTGIHTDRLPDYLERADLPVPDHILLVDSAGRVHEIHSEVQARLPEALVAAIRSRFQAPATARTAFLQAEERPYLVIGDRIQDADGSVVGNLVVARRIDSVFLAASQQGLWIEREAVALVDGDRGRIVSSIDPETLRPGSDLDAWREHYLVTTQALPRYVDSDWDLQFATFVSHASVERMSRHVRSFEWRQRALAAVAFILVFTLLIYLVSLRLNSVLKRMSRFAHRALDIEQPGFRQGGNQLLLLEDWIKEFTQLVLRARQELSRRHEYEMRETQALKAAIMEAALDSIVTIEQQGRIVEFNATAEKAFGLRRRADIGRGFVERVLLPSHRGRFEALLAASRRAQREGRDPCAHSELAARREDGSAMPVEMSIVPIDVGDQTFYTLYLRDITKRLQSEREIKSLARFASESPNPILRVGRDGVIAYANPASRPLLLDWVSAPGMRLPPDWAREIGETLADGATREREVIVDGQVFALLLTPIVDLGYVNIYGRDITAVRRAEQEARQHQAELVHVCRLSTLGEVATGMAHELNQPLSAIVNYANGASRRLQGTQVDSAQLIEAMGQITTQAERASEIIRRLRALVAKQAPIRAVVDLNRLVREVRSFVELDAKRLDVTLVLELCAAPVPVNVDLVQIEQVLLNLARNALDALAGSDVEERRLEIRTRITGDEAEIEVTDNGSGIDPQEMTHLFDPFFTTKPSGMGMGLTISRTILEDHQGRIWAESAPGVATVFHVILPVARGTAQQTAKQERS